nr:MAG TPA: hypothetical protein [Caudoviricetes sp.]
MKLCYNACMKAILNALIIFTAFPLIMRLLFVFYLKPLPRDLYFLRNKKLNIICFCLFIVFFTCYYLIQ